MKKVTKKLLALVLVLTMAVIAPVGAQAASVVKEETAYAIYYPKTNIYTYEQQIGISEKSKFTSLKSSRKSVATVVRKKTSGKYSLYVVPRKTGTTTISYKLNGVKHTQKVIVKKYVNPYKKVTINGKDITAQFKKSNAALVSYQKYKNKKVTIKYKMKKNWAQVHTDYCRNGKILKCLGTFKYKMSVNKPKKNSTVESSQINHKDMNSDEYSVILFK